MEREHEHGLLSLPPDSGERGDLETRLRDLNRPSELLTLLADALGSTSTEFQAARLKRMGGVAVKESKAGGEASPEQRADWALAVRVVGSLLLQPSANTWHLFMPLARVLDALHSDVVTEMLMARWGCSWPPSAAIWLQFSTLLGGAHQKLHPVALALRMRFVTLLLRRAGELTAVLDAEGSRDVLVMRGCFDVCSDDQMARLAGKETDAMLGVLRDFVPRLKRAELLDDATRVLLVAQCERALAACRWTHFHCGVAGMALACLLEASTRAAYVTRLLHDSSLDLGARLCLCRGVANSCTDGDAVALVCETV